MEIKVQMVTKARMETKASRDPLQQAPKVLKALQEPKESKEQEDPKESKAQPHLPTQILAIQDQDKLGFVPLA
jgi:hypothetical protein